MLPPPRCRRSSADRAGSRPIRRRARRRCAVAERAEGLAVTARPRATPPTSPRRSRRAPRSGRGGRRAGRSRPPGRGAAQEDVVRLTALAVGVARGRPLEAEVADPVLAARVRAAVQVQAELGDLVAEAPLEMLDSAPSRVFVSATAKLQCGSPVQPIESPRSEVASSGKPISRERRGDVVDASATPVRTKFCWRVTRTSRPCSSARSASASIWSPRDQAEVYRARRRVRPGSCSRLRRPCGRRPRGRAAPACSRGARSRAAARPPPHALRAAVVDHELEPRLHARDPVAEVLLPRVEERAAGRARLVVADRRRRGRGRSAAPTRGRRRRAPRTRSPSCIDADERDAVDLRRVAAVGAGRDRDLVLAREVGVVRVAVEELGASSTAGSTSKSSSCATPATGQPVMLRTASPQAPTVVSPLRRARRTRPGASRARGSGAGSSVAWRAPRRRGRAVRELADARSCSGVRRPAGSLIRSMNVPIFGLSW